MIESVALIPRGEVVGTGVIAEVTQRERHRDVYAESATEFGAGAGKLGTWAVPLVFAVWGKLVGWLVHGPDSTPLVDREVLNKWRIRTDIRGWKIRR